MDETNQGRGNRRGDRGSRGRKERGAGREKAPKPGRPPRTDRDSGARRSNNGGGKGGGFGSRPDKPKRRKARLIVALSLTVLLVLGGGFGAWAYIFHKDRVLEFLHLQPPIDYQGDGNGTKVVVTIQAGDIGADVANTLHNKGVTMTFKAFYKLVSPPNQEVTFFPGSYSLEKHMSAQSALDALLNPDNKITDKLLITEGTTLPGALALISDTTGIPLDELKTASKDLKSFGLPKEAPSLEGYLFPATYQLDGGQSAHDVLQLLVNTMFEHLDAAGVAPQDRHKVLTMASIIQREAGSNPDDFYKVSRVFTNRLDQGIHLESDATVAYGTGHLHTVWTTDAQRADASDKYNTYANPGLPIGPIGLPGDLAIDAALHPANGPWLFFVPVNLKTGETVFSQTVAQHDAAVAQLRQWCRASDENRAYCE
ncbi:MAG: endolytic transglycosylase MltG [Salinibacterium sp.]|nr:MAG: endolytic transglycosylase MltG [Salinibacterium sp.]